MRTRPSALASCAVLLGERHERPVRRRACRQARSLQLHQSEEAENLGFVREQAGEDAPKALRFLIDVAGIDNVLLGTDYSFPPADMEPLALLRAASLSRAEIAAIADDNPRRVFARLGSPALHALVNDINIKRKAAYTRQAAAAGATVEQLAFTSGCTLVEQTAAGEKYRTPGGVWKTRTAAAPERDARCG